MSMIAPRSGALPAKTSTRLLQRRPHLDVALGGPDARMVEALGFVVSARHVERHAVLEDHPVAVAWLQRRHRLVVGLLQRIARLGALRHGLVEIGQERLGAGDAL